MTGVRGAENLRTRLGTALLFLISCAITMGLVEVGLRIAGFEFALVPEVQFGWPDPLALQLYDPDPDLFWVPKQYRAVLEAARWSHPAVVFMGDSCTEFGRYPEITLKRLSEVRPDVASGVSLAVAGWSSEQGLTQLRRDILPLHPAIITLYFGWNDHWVALGPPDAEISRTSFALDLSAHSRLVQLGYKAWMVFARASSERPNRVELPRYRRNIETMIQTGRRAGARMVVITAASNHAVGREPEYLKQRHLRRLSDLVSLHEAYVEATRAVARSAGATLCDAASAFRSLPPPAEQYFRKDGIHLTLAGDRALASMLAACIVSTLGPER